MSNHDSANAPGLPSRRRFLSLAGKAGAAAAATATALGGLGAAAAISQPAIAALPSAAAPELSDPVFELAERFLEANRVSSAAYAAMDEFEPMDEWTKNNPEPQRREVPMHPRAALNMNFDRTKKPADDVFFDRETGAILTQEEAWGDKQERALAEQEHKEAMRKWNRRRQAAERRTGYRKLQQAHSEAHRLFFETQAALCDAIPLTWEGLAAKARAFRKTYGEGEQNLMRALMLDIAVVSGGLDRANARPASDEEYANA